MGSSVQGSVYLQLVQPFERVLDPRSPTAVFARIFGVLLLISSGLGFIAFVIGGGFEALAGYVVLWVFAFVLYWVMRMVMSFFFWIFTGSSSIEGIWWVILVTSPLWIMFWGSVFFFNAITFAAVFS